MSEDDREFYLAFGYAMAGWARLELWFADVFRRTTGLKRGLSQEIFFSARSFQGRADMLQACIPSVPAIPTGREFIKRAVSLANIYSQSRNHLAHGSHYIGRLKTEPEGLSRRFIHAGDRSGERAITLQEINNFKNNLHWFYSIGAASLGGRPFFTEPELSLALLDLLPTNPETDCTDEAKAGPLLDELALHLR
jgi:hypothetical protein